MYSRGYTNQGLLVASRGHFSEKVVYQLRSGLFRVGVLVASRGHFSEKVVYQLRSGLFRVGVLVASRGHFSGRSPCHSGLPQVPFPKQFC